MIKISSKLTVKELAGPVGKSVSFLYKARLAGLPMEWDAESRCLVQTPDEVRRWIKSNRFRLVKGRGEKGVKTTPIEQA